VVAVLEKISTKMSVPWWVRAYLLFGAYQGIVLGGTGLLSPDNIQIPLRVSPLNERFVGALYLAGGIAALLAAFSRRRAEARLFTIGFLFATTVILLEIFLRWNDYLADPLPNRPAFFAAYVLDVLLGFPVVIGAGYLTQPPRAFHRLTWLFRVEAVVLGVVGIGLLVAPDLLAGVWPWALPAVLSQLYAAFFLSLALGAWLAAGESHAVAIRNFAIGSLALAALILVASLLHLARFKSGPVTWIWFATFGIGLVGFAIASVREAVPRWAK
jgi:hypothetical protein